MTPALLARVLDEVASDEGIALDRIELHNGGETLMHSNLSAMYEVIRERKAALPPVHLLTNAGLLTERKAMEILDGEAIDKVRFSVDGGDPETFEHFREPAKWSKIRDNIQRFLDFNEQHARPVTTGVICLVGTERELSTDWMHPEFRELFGRIDEVAIRYPHNWDGSADLGVDDATYQRVQAQSAGKLCYFLVKDLVVLPNGEVTVCCADLNSRGVIGEIGPKTLRELHEGPVRQRMLELFAAGRKDDIELCSGCTGYYD